MTDMALPKHIHISGILLLAALAGCTQKQESPQEIKERTAQATADLKRDTKAIAEGIREGWSRDKPLDLNSATKDQLVSLPGVTEAEAGRIIAARPYDDPGDLVTRRVMSKTEYDKISDRVVAKK
jgi:competence protein ComEA